MVKGEEPVEQLMRPILSQDHVFEPLEYWPPLSAASQVKKAGRSSIRGECPVPRWRELRTCVAIRMGAIRGTRSLLCNHLLPQLDDFALHLGIARSLPNTLEIVLASALEVEALAACAQLEGFLHDIASELESFVSEGATTDTEFR